MLCTVRITYFTYHTNSVIIELLLSGSEYQFIKKGITAEPYMQGLDSQYFMFEAV